MKTMMRPCVGVLGALILGGGISAQKPPLLPEKDVAALANELSGETAKRNLEGIARFHRQRGSQGFHAAAELVAERLRAYGLSDVEILQFPADGKVFYGTQRSRPAWDAEKGELSEVEEVKNVKEIKEKSGLVVAPARTSLQAPVCDKERVVDGKLVFNTECWWPGEVKVASYAAEPIVLAEESESADVTAELVDVGEGTKESDYAGKEVKGKIVLVGAQPGAVQDLAIGKLGAAGIVSYAQNQRTAWWGEDENLIRWGHLETFSPNKTFAFMLSLKTARGFRERLTKGEKIMLHAVVKAGQHPGNYEVVTATIPGAEAKLKDEEIAFSCHLDHQRPGANDNASGCVTILEVARALEKLITQGKLTRPARTIRFYWPPEIEGTMALLTSPPRAYKMELDTRKNYDGSVSLPQSSGGSLSQTGASLAKRLKAVIHMDMVGGGPETKAVFHVTRGPMSLPSFVHDVAWAFAEWVNEESYKFAATGSADYPLVAPEGGKEPLRAEYSAYTMGSDHDVYQDSSFGIPAIYLNDWPDRYIHTNFDSAANIDPTKLKRAAFISAASGYFLANRSNRSALTLWHLANRGVLHQRLYRGLRSDNLPLGERLAESLPSCLYETKLLEEARTMVHELPEDAREGFMAEMPKCFTGYAPQGVPPPQLNDAWQIKFKRSLQVRGPLAVFGYDYFADHAKTAGVATPKLLSYEGLWGGGEEYAYEVLNFADGKRNAQEIRDAVSAEYGPVPLELVIEYLRALDKIGVVEPVKREVL